MISHGYGYETLYAHLNEYKVRPGQRGYPWRADRRSGQHRKIDRPALTLRGTCKGQPDNPAKYYFMDLSPAEYDKMLQIAANHGQVMD